MAFALNLNNISCEIDDRLLFTALSTQINSGDFVQIIGPNGAGKTTLLRIITGLSSHYEGELTWCGKDIPCYEFYSSLLYIGHSIGVKASLTPRENLHWYFGLNGIKSDAERQVVSPQQIESAIEKVGLAGYEDVPSYQMSAGQQRRVALARLYLSQAPLWVLDEPFTAIDKHGVTALEKHLNQHRQQGGIVILTTHQSMSHVQPKIIDLANFAGQGA